MKEMNKTTIYNTNKNKLEKDYISSLKDEQFKKIVNRLKIKDEIGMKYTSKIEHTVNDLKNCEKCKGLLECKNNVEGCVYYPTLIDEKLEFNYVACKYKTIEINENKKNKTIVYGINDLLRNASLSDIYTDDSKRIELIKWVTTFCHDYPKTKKGLYLHGSFGCGKTYIIAALLNELAKKNYKTIMIYFPELLTKLKSTFDSTTNNYSDIFDEIKTCNILLIDDIGAETVTNWSRDEILGTILQYRMENDLTTFLTSNLNINELETHLSIIKNNTDKVKSRRIIERIKQLTTDMELISKNRRN